MSYLSRHRPICAVLTEIKEIAATQNDDYVIKLCDEAIEYAQSMSKKLAEYKAREPRPLRDDEIPY